MTRTVFAAALLAAAGCGAPPVPPSPEPTGPTEPPKVVAEETVPPKPASDDDVLPPAKSAPVSALTGKIYLPADGGRWPAKFAPAPPKVEGTAVHLTLGYGAHGMAVSPESGRFVIAQRFERKESKTDPLASKVVVGALTTGKVVGSWEIGGQFDLCDMSPDGTRVVAKSVWPDAKLTLLTITPDNGLSRVTVEAHDRVALNPNEAGANKAELNVVWAGFVGNDRVASAADGGQVRVFKTAGLAKVGTLDGTPKLTPCVTPDRKRLLAHAGGKVVLIDPAECQAVATKDWPLPGGPKNLAASPDGETLACAKAGRVRFLGLRTGEVWDQMMPQFGDHAMQPRYFNWAGPANLVHSRRVFDVTLPYSVWSYSHHTHAEASTPRQVWAAVRLPGQKEAGGVDRAPVRVAVRAFDPLPPNLPAVVAAGKARPNIYVLAPGSPVKVDASALPAAKRADAKADLEQRLREVGFVPNPAAAAVITLTLDPAVTKNTPYANLTNVPYAHQPLRVELKAGGKKLWTHTEVKSPPGFITLVGGQTLAARAAADGFGQPKYEALRGLDVPRHFPGPGFPDQGFGSTHLTPDGPQYSGGR